MKYIIILSFLIAYINLNAQNSPLKFEETVNVDSTILQSELFVQAKNWLFKTFNNSEAVIQNEDKSAGQIAGKGVFKYNAPKWWGGGTEGAGGHVRFSIQLFFKDGKYKYIITDFTHEPKSDKSFGIITDSENPPMKSHMSSKKRAELIWKDLQSKVELESEVLINSLKESMKSKQNNDW